jgi:hypothetical protein
MLGGTARAPPVLDHPRLRQREGEERTDGKEGNEAIGDPAKDHEQSARQEREDDDAVREDEASPADRDAVRHRRDVLSNGPAS